MQAGVAAERKRKIRQIPLERPDSDGSSSPSGGPLSRAGPARENLASATTMIRQSNSRNGALAAIWAGAALVVAGCVELPDRAQAPSADLTEVLPVFAASDALVEKWRRVQVWGTSDWQLVVVEDEVAIEPLVDGSSSALVRWIEFETRLCPVAEWSWRVDALPEGADLGSRDAEDVAASVMFVFGDPGALSNPNPVPTIRYVWATDGNADATVINSPYFPKMLRNIVVRLGPAGGEWITEQRNLHEDYVMAFGKPPAETVKVFALFSDNDHLSEPVTAYYRAARMLCSELPEKDTIF